MNRYQDAYRKNDHGEYIGEDLSKEDLDALHAYVMGEKVESRMEGWWQDKKHQILYRLLLRLTRAEKVSEPSPMRVQERIRPLGNLAYMIHPSHGLHLYVKGQDLLPVTSDEAYEVAKSYYDKEELLGFAAYVGDPKQDKWYVKVLGAYSGSHIDHFDAILDFLKKEVDKGSSLL